MGPKVVALGGGHGLSIALRAIREYAGEITAVVSVADDGGSSGRLRRDFDVPAPGDLRRCLVALAREEGPWPAAFEHRFGWGELAGHALGNLMLVGLAATLGDLTAALDEAGRVLGAVGRVVPATLGTVSMTAEVGRARVVGQVAIARAGEKQRIHDVRLEPPDASAHARCAQRDRGGRPDRHCAGLALHQHRCGAVCAGAARRSRGATGTVVQVANLATEDETNGHDGTEHLAAVRAHGGRVDVFMYDPEHGLAVDEAEVVALGARAAPVPIARPRGWGHDPPQLAKALSALL